jgi:hypothetical protein
MEEYRNYQLKKKETPTGNIVLYRKSGGKTWNYFFSYFGDILFATDVSWWPTDWLKQSKFYIDRGIKRKEIGTVKKRIYT